MRPLSKMEVSADILLRALAITMVTYNHAHPYPTFAPGWGGGMTFLMMLSGYNFAKFGMQGASPTDGRLALARLGSKILIPSVILVLFFFVILRKFDWAELFFYRNWITVQRISKFPTWYPQVIIQMFGALLLLFSIPKVAAWIFRHPLPASLIIYSIAVAVRAVFPQVWDTAPLHHFLPHLFLWNFTLGWVVYFCVTGVGGQWGKVLAVAAAVLGASFGWGIHALDFWWLTIGVTLLVLPLNLRLYTPVARFFFIVSQATFAIFLLHRFVYEIYEHVPVPQDQNAEWLVGYFGSIGLWMAAVIPLRAYRAIARRTASSSMGAPMLQR
jgi:hypothetical protein